MKLCIAGSRTFTDYLKLKRTIDAFRKKNPTIDTIISGTADGADRLGESYAIENKLKLERMPADWIAYGKKAGPIRNEAMAKAADMIVVFWDGKSKGTRNMIQTAKKLNKPTYIFSLKEGAI